jgi:hypothetical protein
MEQKKKQIRNCIYRFVQTWWPWLLETLLIVLFIAFICALISCRSSKVVSDRDVKDSVVYTYKTLYRDSLRVKDSTVLVYQTVQRDSVVLRVDKATGEVLSTDSWHWNDTNRYMGHASEVKSKTEKSDSVGTKAKSSVVVSKKEIPTNLATKTHYWRTFFIGMSLGVLLSVAFKYRKKIFCMLVNMC